MAKKKPKIKPATKKRAESEVEEVITEVVKEAKKEEEKIVPTEQLVTFELDKEEYASIITDLREIIKIPEIVPIPGAPEFIEGILNLRGQIVVIINLEERFNLEREHQVTPRHIVIAEVQDSVFGIIVDEVTDVMRVPVDSIKPTPRLITSKIKADYLKGVVVLEPEEQEAKETKKVKQAKETKEAARLILLLDLPKLLAEKELLEFTSTIKKTVEKTK